MFGIIGVCAWALLKDRIWIGIGVSTVLTAVMIVGVANAGHIYENADRTVFMFTGKIEMGNSREILHATDKSKLYMESPGGDAWEALQIGYIIKAKELDVSTYEGKPCDSACAFAAIMGKTIKGKYGFHAPYAKGHNPTEMETQFVYDMFRKYMKSTGKLTDAQIEKILSTPSSDLMYITW